MFFNKVLVQLKTQLEFTVEKFCETYSIVLLNLCRMDCIIFFDDLTDYFYSTSIPLLKTMSDQTRLDIYNKIVFLLQKNIFDKLYNSLKSCDLQITKLNGTTALKTMDCFKNIICDLYSACNLKYFSPSVCKIVRFVDRRTSCLGALQISLNVFF
jgi:hypothetical protein